MRTLFLHANRFESEIVAPSNRPAGIIPEENKSSSKKMENCLVILFCLEVGDSEQQIDKLYHSILADAKQVNTKNIMISPFVHLSNNIAYPVVAKELYQLLLRKFENTHFNVDYSHFGYAKTMLLDVKGHRCAYKYREFY